ncbi:MULTISPECIES: 1-acyl-sn-glycerol-3-phosphate acyltransferase [unclassified Leptolyngbya]|uniref:1-acyl-sn-glycerol-3-phosphate acyltransferase n=1 Tax=unclassified Leptolyngbya TaxID=2650499 RepID=UPI001686C4C8|nr:MULTISPECIES: 1-acyl-sn-glycerol-3-phosphate acyltransferase [unclassified Leptolyngbya]MBD1909620.1 1-acyl-sn-glycerol-3-phosphate acyltransferase [Leptolyngbya sp. FACHB-8]MBD2154158.1 1-acyl-sn-glycerol-3-phosphate acyltransferase [Leptolyngbya sp. FACHB-16]
MAKPLSVQPPLEFIPPNFQTWVWWGARSLLPYRLRYSHNIADVQVQHIERLVDLYHQFEQGKARFLLAFRHPSTSDPECLLHLSSYVLPAAARQQGVSLSNPTHFHFIYDRGIPLWAGQYVGWLYSRLGGIPIRRGKVDTTGLRTIRQLFVEGRFPIAAAPEGATNGHNELVSPIEPGIAQFGFWCAEDLKKGDRSELVYILPVGLQYDFISPPWHRMAQLLHQLEVDSGLVPESDFLSVSAVQDGVTPTSEQQTQLYQRLFRLGVYLLGLMEEYYSRFYRQPVATLQASAGTRLRVPENISNEALAERLQALLNSALGVAEQFFGLQPKGSLADRCRRLEQAAWDRIFREDIKDLDALPAVERGLADRIAEESDFHIWHMRLVETFVSVTGNYVREKPSAERFGETLTLLWDMVSRLKGQHSFPYPMLGQRRARLSIGEPLSVSDRMPDYHANRRQAVAALTQDLQTALEAMIQA